LYRHNSAAVISVGEATVATALPPSVWSALNSSVRPPCLFYTVP